MKIIKNQLKCDPTLKEVVDHLNVVYGEKAETDFDKFCVYTYEIVFENAQPKLVWVVYNKVRVCINQTYGYWPIDLHREEMGVKAARKLIEGLE